MSPRALLVGLLASLPSAGCQAPTAGAARAAITNGTTDAGDPAIVAILDATAAVQCTGTLVAPHAVLTAAHCMIDSSSFDRFTVSFGAMAAAPGAFVISDAQAHPSFDPTTLADDLALVTLLRAGPAAPVALDARSLDATWVGQSFTAVGFGTTGPSADDTGTKRSGTAKVTGIDAIDFTSAPSPSQPCAGDSGGPALFVDAGTTVLSGVVSHGDSGCVDHTTFSRVDVAQDFIEPYLSALVDGSAALGDRCYFDEQCTSGPCLQELDEPRRFFCSQPCARNSDCPAAMVCAADGCRYRTPSPGALGASCAQPSDCASNLCNTGKCTRSCVPTATDCPSGFACRNTSDITFECVAMKPSGCDFSSSGGGDASWWMAGLVLVACAGRRRDRQSVRRPFASLCRAGAPDESRACTSRRAC